MTLVAEAETTSTASSRVASSRTASSRTADCSSSRALPCGSGGMASLPWVPWHANRTEVLSPAQIERIVRMHRESKQNAIIYVLVVLALYFVALAILVGRYLHHERDHDLVVCLGQALERCVATCRRATAPSASTSPGATPTAGKEAVAPPAISITAAPARKFSLKLTSWTAPPVGPPRPSRTTPRTRAPQTDDESSDSSSPPYSPRGCDVNGTNGHASETLSDGAPSFEASMDGLGWQSAFQPCGVPGRASPAVVSVMVCDLQDTQV